MHTPEVKRPRSGVQFRNRGLSKIASHHGNNPMKRKITRPAAGRNDGGLPLFDWADSVRRRTRPIAVSHVQRLYNVSPSVARLYAELAGLSVEDRT